MTAIDYPHQRTGAAFLAGRRVALLADEPGLGKSRSAIVASDLIGARKILVVCPGAVRNHWAVEFERWSAAGRPVAVVGGLVKKPPGDGVTVVSHATLSDAPALRPRAGRGGSIGNLLAGAPYDLLIVDECFPGDTLVCTDEGAVPIREIVDNGRGSFVFSFNRATNRIDLKAISRRMRRPPPTNLVRVTHEHGYFTCTPEHKIALRSGGYETAACLTVGAELLTLQPGVHGGAVVSTLLQLGVSKATLDAAKTSTVRSVWGAHTSTKQKHKMLLETLCWYSRYYFAKKSANKQNMSSMWDCFFRKRKGQTTSRAANMLQAMRLRFARSSPGRARRFYCANIANMGLLERAICTLGYGAHAPEAECVLGGGARKDESCPQRKNVSKPRWQREVDSATGKTRLLARACGGVRDWAVSRTWRVLKSAYALQGRCCGSLRKGGYRSGRSHAHDEKVEIPGSSQNRGIGISRVVSVEVLEQGSRPGLGRLRAESDNVYDIEVADNHNYFADGVLVSNCAEFRQYNAQRTRTLFSGDGLASRCTRTWCLSGTPFVNSAADLYPMVFGAIGSRVSWEEFCDHYCDMKPDAYLGVKPIGIRNAGELADGLRPFVLRRTIASLGIELPPLVVDRAPLAGVDPAAIGQAMAGLEGWTPERLAAALEQQDELRDLALARVRRALGIAKALPAAAHVESILASGEGPVVVFFQHTDVRKAMHAALAAGGRVCSWLDGTVTRAQLVAAVDWFQAGRIDVLLVQTQAGGIGISLTRSHRAVVAELPWTATALFQAVKRVHRISQTVACRADVLQAPGCWLDEAMATVVEGKRRAADDLMDRLTSDS